MSIDLRPDTPPDVRPVAASVAELLGPDAVREPFASTDGKSGVTMERVSIDGERFILKHLNLEDDWTMRATGDLTCRPITVWRTGLLDQVPGCLDHTVVGAAWDDQARRQGGALLMRDVGDALLPEGDHTIPLDQHLAFLDHMAQLHVAFWEARDTLDLFPLPVRLVFFGPRLGRTERARGGTDVVPTELVPAGWERFPERAPRAAQVVLPLLDEPAPLVAALSATPQTLVHGDWKAGNLGHHPDGRTILIDWAVPGVAPPCIDAAWYACLNRSRLPQSKEATLLTYRESLERHGVDTAPWWDRQSALCLLSLLLMFGWEKSLGDGEEAAEELAWWEDRALEGAEELSR